MYLYHCDDSGKVTICLLHNKITFRQKGLAKNKNKLEIQNESPDQVGERLIFEYGLEKI